MERSAEPRPATAPPAVEPTPVVPAPVTPAQVAVRQRTSKAWTIGIPVAILILVGIIWAVVAGMPFGGPAQQSRQTTPIGSSDRPAVDTIAEGTSTAATGSIGDTNDMRSEQPVTPPPTTSAAPRPAYPTATQPPPPRQPAQTQISETEARAILARYLDARDPYHTPGNCMVVRGTGFLNRGYGFDVFDHCQSQRLGSWRVDSMTRELFEQKADGRYLRP